MHDNVLSALEKKFNPAARFLPQALDCIEILNQRRIDRLHGFHLLPDTQPDKPLKAGQNTLGFALVYCATHELQGFEWAWDQDSSGPAVSDLTIRYYRFANQATLSPVWVEHNGGYVTHTPFETGVARYGHAKFTVPVIASLNAPLPITAVFPLKDPRTGQASIVKSANFKDFLPSIVKAFNIKNVTNGVIKTGADLSRQLKIVQPVRRNAASRRRAPKP